MTSNALPKLVRYGFSTQAGYFAQRLPVGQTLRSSTRRTRLGGQAVSDELKV